MAVEIVTKEDLHHFRNELVSELKQLFSTQKPQEKQWLKSPEVRKMLNISPGTLQNLRIYGTLSYTKIGGILYYGHEDIQKLMQSNKRDARR